MKKFAKNCLWLLEIIGGCALFALAFDIFLEPNDINAGGLSGLAMIVVHLIGRGSTGFVTLLFNIPLFLCGWKIIGRRFFVGSLIGAVALSGFLELFELLPHIAAEPILAALYGGIIGGAGLGLVFFAGASTGGSDIIVRLLKYRWRNIPIGRIQLGFDATVALLTGLVFWNFDTILYCGIVIYLSSRLVDAVVYSFDYSNVAVIISEQYEEIVRQIDVNLGRGATYLYGEGSYKREETKVVLAAVKRSQLSELKRLVTEIDENAFVILLDSHQVLGDGFNHYSKDSL